MIRVFNIWSYKGQKSRYCLSKMLQYVTNKSDINFENKMYKWFVNAIKYLHCLNHKLQVLNLEYRYHKIKVKNNDKINFKTRINRSKSSYISKTKLACLLPQPKTNPWIITSAGHYHRYVIYTQSALYIYTHTHTNTPFPPSLEQMRIMYIRESRALIK